MLKPTSRSVEKLKRVNPLLGKLLGHSLNGPLTRSGAVFVKVTRLHLDLAQQSFAIGASPRYLQLQLPVANTSAA